MALVDFTAKLHTATKRDYVARVVDNDKALCAEVAGRYDKDYWDGDRKYGFGGYRYDGRWRPVAEAMAKHYTSSPALRSSMSAAARAFSSTSSPRSCRGKVSGLTSELRPER